MTIKLIVETHTMGEAEDLTQAFFDTIPAHFAEYGWIGFMQGITRMLPADERFARMAEQLTTERKLLGTPMARRTDPVKQGDVLYVVKRHRDGMLTAEPPSMVDEAMADPVQALEMVAATALVEGTALLNRVREATGATVPELAGRVGVTVERAEQVLSGDVNLRLSTMARYLWAMGHRFDIGAAAVAGSAKNPTEPCPPACDRGDTPLVIYERNMTRKDE